MKTEVVRETLEQGDRQTKTDRSKQKQTKTKKRRSQTPSFSKKNVKTPARKTSVVDVKGAIPREPVRKRAKYKSERAKHKSSESRSSRKSS